MLPHIKQLNITDDGRIAIEYNYNPLTLQQGDLPDLAQKLKEKVATIKPSTAEFGRMYRILQIIDNQKNIDERLDNSQRISFGSIERHTSLSIIECLVYSIRQVADFNSILASLTHFLCLEESRSNPNQSPLLFRQYTSKTSPKEIEKSFNNDNYTLFDNLIHNLPHLKRISSSNQLMAPGN